MRSMREHNAEAAETNGCNDELHCGRSNMSPSASQPQGAVPVKEPLAECLGISVASS